MSIKVNEVSLTVSVGAEGHLNVTQAIINLIPSLKPEQISVDKRVYEDNEAFEIPDAKKNADGDLILNYKNYGNKDNQPLYVTVTISR